MSYTAKYPVAAAAVTAAASAAAVVAVADENSQNSAAHRFFHSKLRSEPSVEDFWIST